MKVESLRFAALEDIYSNYVSKVGSVTEIETLDTLESLERVCAKDIFSLENLPGFDKSLVDGYALRALDTRGASSSMPALLKIAFEVHIGKKPDKKLIPGEAAWVPTGGAIPEGADAVVMVEHTQGFGEFVEIMKPVSAGENVMKFDEDIKRSDRILEKGTLLKSGHVQLLLQLGLMQIEVFRKVKVAIISTGDEIVEPWQKPDTAQVRDSNTYTLKAWIEKHGFVAERVSHVKDDEESLYESLKKFLNDYDLIVIAGGSSIGPRDYTARAIERLGKPGIIYHGALVQPGKPTIFAMIGEKPVLGLPGNPVSFFVSSRFFLLPVLRKLAGANDFTTAPSGFVILAKNVPSIQGREHFVRVKTVFKNGKIFAEQLFSESAHLSNIANADGVIRIPLGVEGINAGEFAEFYQF